MSSNSDRFDFLIESLDGCVVRCSNLKFSGGAESTIGEVRAWVCEKSW